MALAKRAAAPARRAGLQPHPIARLEFMRDVLASAADTGLTVILASHVVSELERFCDWLIILTSGRVQLAGSADDLIAAHQLLTVPRETSDTELPGPPVHPRRRPLAAITTSAVAAVLFGLGGWAFHDMYQFPFGRQLVVVHGPGGTVELKPSPGVRIGGPGRRPGGPGRAGHLRPSGGPGVHQGS